MNPLPYLQLPTVLLVDGDEKQSLLRRRELEAEGYRVVCTHSGREAFATFEREPIDAVVVDFMLPDMHVLDLIDGIVEKRSQTPIVVNSPFAAYNHNFRYWVADAIFDQSFDAGHEARGRRLPEVVASLL
jgi:CheY-like chemotaxis protein